MELSSYKLRKWRRFCLIRDKATCQMCAVVPGVRRLEVHHSYPKSLYPARACLLDNGVTLCVRCHRGCVHAENTWDLNNWKRFVVLFRYWQNLKHCREFNSREQHRID